MADAQRAIQSSTAATAPAGPRTDTASGPPRPARPQSADVTRETTVDEAARRLAADLRSVPDIQRYSDVRLAQLDRTGPRPLRTLWRVAREELDERFSEVTIGELLDRYGSGTPS